MKILLVEDNEIDVVLTKSYLDDVYADLQLDVVNNGADAIDFLLQQQEFSHCEEPDIVLLDLNLPKIDGLEVLQVVKNTQGKKHIPIIILTTSVLTADKNFALQNGALAYWEKPLDIALLKNILYNNSILIED
ncbi:response regulator [Marivirga tractuosa]|uniref:Response regulator receiver protein n=1 Tax=Marivirga tractuosa (strain ATCC 23168 / DSM 4126 / NBRC 15989 / NCIMB 1408 / VKM B-1430 / H-43) TaxID=643867 RepID=E4TV93_MARTH|nr:response regulator [Marivirga tractuosa]ADR23158.1 response regulator receiver protein [Marivirga tractuosa DSM 4126]BDD16168.1 response regulator [Marivirga tractuosa]